MQRSESRAEISPLDVLPRCRFRESPAKCQKKRQRNAGETREIRERNAPDSIDLSREEILYFSYATEAIIYRVSNREFEIYLGIPLNVSKSENRPRRVTRMPKSSTLHAEPCN